MLPRSVDVKDKNVFLIDQTLIPAELKIIQIDSLDDMVSAIKTMIVRGAPAIGIAAAAGMALFIEQLSTLSHQDIVVAGQKLKAARPTAVNLAWAVDQLVVLSDAYQDLNELKEAVWGKVMTMADEDEAINRAIGRHGADLIPSKKKVSVLTHCNAGSLATVYWGTALGVIRELHQRLQLSMTYADETRPRLQGGKITSWELAYDQIPVTVLTDNMAGHAMQQGLIDLVVVGADRIAANGDAANKIGTYSVAVLANYHKIPFYIAAPLSTFDMSLDSGQQIPIEERGANEVTHINGLQVMPDGIQVMNPAFDVTPAELITGIITEKGVVLPQDASHLFEI